MPAPSAVVVNFPKTTIDTIVGEFASALVRKQLVCCWPGSDSLHPGLSLRSYYVQALREIIPTSKAIRVFAYIPNDAEGFLNWLRDVKLEKVEAPITHHDENDAAWLATNLRSFLGGSRPLDSTVLKSLPKDSKILCVDPEKQHPTLRKMVPACFPDAADRFVFQCFKPSDGLATLRVDASGIGGLLYVHGNRLVRMDRELKAALKGRYWEGPEPTKVLQQFYRALPLLKVK